MVRTCVWLVASLGCGLVLLQLTGALGQAPAPPVLLMHVSGKIDLGMAPYTSRVLHAAEAQGAAAVILRINTPGGRVDAAINMRDALLNAKVNTIAFIDKEAYSAGALIALASNKIYMTGGAVIGAAAPVLASGEPLGEKHVSAIRKLFRATAERNGRPPEVAEAMVDEDVVIPELIAAGKLLTLTTQEALQWNVADGQIDTLDALLQHLNLSPEALTPVRLNWAESLVRFITQPSISVLLLLAGLLALWIEFMEPGISIGAVVGLICLGLFFSSHYLVGLAGWEEALLIGLGVVLIAVELFVIPGVGVTGILGGLALGAGVYLSFLGQYPTPAQVWTAARSLLAVFILGAIGIGVMLAFLPRMPLWSRLSLRTRLDQGAGQLTSEETRPASPLLGAIGMTVTPLGPSGIGLFQGKRLDIISEGAYIPVDTPVTIVHIEGNRFVVRPAKPPPT